jgi:PAS domain S-box-containing protein
MGGLDPRGGEYAFDMMIAGGLGAMGLIPVVFYLIHRRDRGPLWLGLFCIVLSGHFLFGAQRTIYRILAPQAGPEALATLEALTWYLSLPFLAFFVREVQREGCPDRHVRALFAACLTASALVIVLPARLHLYITPVMEVITVAVAAWLTFVLAANAWRQRSGWVGLLALMPMLYPLVIFDVMQNPGLRIALLPLGLAGFVIAPVAVLARRLVRNQTKFMTDLMDSVPVALSLRDPGGKYLFVNRTWETWFGEGREQVVGFKVTDRVQPEVAQHLLMLDRAALERGPNAPPFSNDLDFDGRRFAQTRRVMADDAGDIVGVLVATSDTTERKVQEDQLKDQMLLTRAVIEDNPNAMYVKDTAGRYVTVNDAWLKMLGLTREEAIGRTVREILKDAESERYHEQDMKLLAQGQGFSEVETLRTGPDGKPMWIIVRKAVLRRANGEVAGLVGTNTDITPLKHYEKELADRNKFITELIEALPVSVVIRDTEGRHVQVNRAWERYYNVKREEILGKRFIEFPGWKDDPELVKFAEEAERFDRETLTRGPDQTLEPVERRRKGKIYLNTRRALVDTGGKPVGVVGVSLDVTNEKIMAEVLATEQRRLALVVRATKAGIVDWDGVTHTNYYSPRFREILGHAPDVDTRQWFHYDELVHPDDRERFTSRFEKFVLEKDAEGRYSEFFGPEEHRLPRANGEYIWVEVNGVGVRDDKGYLLRMIAAVTDITERRQQEEQLEDNRHEIARQKTILETVLENIDQGISMVDKDMRAIAVNRRFYELLDMPPEHFVAGKFTLEDAFRFNARRGEYGPGDTEEQVHTRMVLARKFEPHVFERKRPNGQFLSVVGKPLPDNTGFVTTYTDITEQKRAEEQLRQSMALREEVERMSRHDLKTPINSVIAVSRMMRESTKIAPEDAELLATVERAGYRILNMVNLSLDLFRMEQGTYEFHPKTVDLDEVASKVATDLQGQAASKNVHVTVSRKGSAVARAEELLCYSIFANLVKNAIEAAPEGSTVTIELDREEERAVARVHNEGVVPEDARARFFQKYASVGKAAGPGARDVLGEPARTRAGRQDHDELLGNRGHHAHGAPAGGALRGSAPPRRAAARHGERRDAGAPGAARDPRRRRRIQPPRAPPPPSVSAALGHARRERARRPHRGRAGMARCRAHGPRDARHGRLRGDEAAARDGAHEEPQAHPHHRRFLQRRGRDREARARRGLRPLPREARGA